jgi:hypothetical protein
MDKEIQLRIVALELAIKADSEDAIETAKVFFEFLKGEANE